MYYKPEGWIYGIKYNTIQYNVGETGRKLRTRITEHQRDTQRQDRGVRTRNTTSKDSNVINKSVITDHVAETNHVPNFDSVVCTGSQQRRK